MWIVRLPVEREYTLVTSSALLTVGFKENPADRLLTLATHAEPEVGQPLFDVFFTCLPCRNTFSKLLRGINCIFRVYKKLAHIHENVLWSTY